MTSIQDLDPCALYNVLKHVDAVTLGRAECVNRLWGRVACDDRLWEPIARKFWASNGMLEFSRDCLRWMSFRQAFRASILYKAGHTVTMADAPSDFNSIPDFYSIDSQVFSSQIRPWVQN